MSSYSEQRARLTRMEAARAETERHLAVIERQIEARALQKMRAAMPA